MVQQKESFLPWSTETEGMKTRQAYRQGRYRSSSAAAPNITGSPDADTEEADKIPSTQQRAGATTARRTSELPQGKHVQDPKLMKPKGMKHCPVVPSGTKKNKELVQLKEALVEANCGDTPLRTGHITTDEEAAGVGSSAAVSPPESTGMSIFSPTLFSILN